MSTSAGGLQQAGHWISFAPAAMVWHHRRQTPRAYLRQQAGYGEAEALLRFKHPDRFNGRGRGQVERHAVRRVAARAGARRRDHLPRNLRHRTVPVHLPARAARIGRCSPARWNGTWPPARGELRCCAGRFLVAVAGGGGGHVGDIVAASWPGSQAMQARLPGCHEGRLCAATE